MENNQGEDAERVRDTLPQSSIVSSVVKDIMGNVVAEKSATNYAYQNSAFANFCYASDELRFPLLEPWFIDRLDQLSEIPSAKKKYMQECFLAMSPEDDNCPFCLSNLTFAHFSNFLSTRTRSRGKNKGAPNSLGVASYDQAKSALVHLFRMSKYEMSGDFSESLKIFMKGMKRVVAKKKMESGDKNMIGKKKMDYKVYEKLCELFMKEEGEEYLFARCFLTLEWNLMARSESIVFAHLFHITWEDDCLVFRFAKSKTDQTGRNKDQLWHVYATPSSPPTCPVLALATYIFANPGLTDSNMSEMQTSEGEDGEVSGRLFPGGDQYGRFMDCLRRTIEKYLDEFLALGISPGDLGSHSARKGACSYASAGSTVCPPMVSICLRAMWSMGSVKERYLQFEKAGDQYLGRVVSGLDVNDVSFATSPPYFEDDNNGMVRENVLTLLRNFVVGGKSIQGEVCHLLYFCFASLCYHFDFLVRTLPRRSKLQASPFFTNIPNYAREAATVRFPWNKTALTPSFTGMPPHVSMLASIEGLKAALDKSRSDILEGVKNDLDGRRIGTQSYFDKEEIIAKMIELYRELGEKVDYVRRQSATALQAGRDDVDFSGPEVTLGEANEGGNLEVSTSILTIVEPGCGKKFQIFYSGGGSISRVHKDFVFPDMTLATLISMWLCGNESKKTIPLKLLKASEIQLKKERYKLSKMRTLMLGVKIAAEKAGVWNTLSHQNRKGAWDVGSAVRLFESVSPYFKYPSKMKSRRDAHISWITVHNLYVAHKKVFATELP